jgi:hypothetical protein
MFGRKYAKPGRWYGIYHDDWEAAHPGAWERRELDSGSFRKGNVWCSSTLAWDRQWFLDHGMNPPRRMRHVKPNPNMIPLVSTLNPGESVTVRVEP